MATITTIFYTVLMPDGNSYEYRAIGESKKKVARKLGIDIKLIMLGANSRLPHIEEYFKKNRPQPNNG